MDDAQLRRTNDLQRDSCRNHPELVAPSCCHRSHDGHGPSGESRENRDGATHRFSADRHGDYTGGAALHLPGGKCPRVNTALE